MLSALRAAARWSAWSIAFVLMIASLLIILTRTLWPILPSYQTYIHSWIAESIDQQIDFDVAAADWTKFGPAIRLTNVMLPKSLLKTVDLKVDRLYFVLDVVDSLKQRKPVAHSIFVDGADFTTNQADWQALFDAKPKNGNETGTTADWTIDLPVKAGLRIENLRGQIQLDSGEIASISNAGLTIKLRDFSTHLDWTGDLSLKGTTTSVFMVTGWKGELSASTIRTAPFYFRVVDLPLSWLNQFSTDWRAEGTASLETWLTFDQRQWQRILTRFELSNVALRGPEFETPFLLSGFAGNVLANNDDDGVLVQLDDVMLSTSQDSWPITNMFVKRSLIQEKPIWSAGGGYIDAKAFAPFSQMLEGSEKNRVVKHILSAIEGEIKDWRLGVNPTDKRLHFTGELENVGWEHADKLPGVQGIDGFVDVTESAMSLELNSGNVTFSAPNLFRQNLELNSLTGTLNLYKYGEQWELVSDRLAMLNPNIEAVARLRSIFTPGVKPYLDLKVSFDGKDGSNAYRYFPAGIMNDRVISWLDTAFLYGNTSNGSVVLNGQLADFPFRNNEGVFSVSSDFEELGLNYHSDWPNIEGAYGRMNFTGSAMQIDMLKGNIFDANVDQATATIADFKNAKLVIKGDVTGTTNALIKYVNESPLQKKFGKEFNSITGDGAATLNLDLSMPLKKDSQSVVQGNIGFQGGSLGLTNYPLAFEDVNGLIAFDNDGIQSDGLAASFRTFPIELNIKTNKQEKGAEISFNLTGRIGSDAIFNQLAMPPIKGIRGASDWFIDVVLPLHPAPLSFTASTDLVGVAIDVPQPATKHTATKQPLHIHADIGKEIDKRWDITVGSDKSAALLLNEDGKLNQLMVHLGGGSPDVNRSAGVYITGDTEYVNIDEWRDYFSTPQRKQLAPNEATPVNDSSTSIVIDANVKRLTVFDFDFNNVDVDMTNRQNAWEVVVNSPDVSGELYWPSQVSSFSPVSATFAQLNVAVEGGDENQRGQQAVGTTNLNPEDVPDMVFVCAQCTYGDFDLGELSFKLKPGLRQLTIDEITAKQGKSTINGHVLWDKFDVTPSTSLELQVESANFGDLLAHMGYSKTMKKGKAKGEVSLNWPVDLNHISRSTLNGDIKFVVRDGEILDVEPGAGRLFGLLSFQALPRRLALDFTDVFSSGFVFDKLSSGFVVENGVANIDDLKITSTSAEVEITGKVDLVEKTYDQVMTVVPDLSTGLGIAGALAGGPGVGAVLYVAQKIIKPTIAQFKYKITGPWENPKLERINAPDPTQKGAVRE